MRFMNIWQYRNELAKNLPYGDQRRVEIARHWPPIPSF